MVYVWFIYICYLAEESPDVYIIYNYILLKYNYVIYVLYIIIYYICIIYNVYLIYMLYIIVYNFICDIHNTAI